jgi:tyrosyl-tRNA synthetase
MTTASHATQITPYGGFLEELTWRGLLYQQTEGARAALAAGSVAGYCGFDPTAASLHVGSLVPIMGLVHLQRAGHRPVALVGGGTGLIGDPSGKPDERPLADLATTAANAESIRGQLARFLDFSGPRGALMRNNADWLVSLGAIVFLRDVGKHFSVNQMLAKESVKSRLDTGISFTEFGYMLLQAYDFLELHRRDGVTLQVGGSDQWGNIVTGVELVRRTMGGEVHGVTFPLMAAASGRKFGKTEEGTIWLDASLTSPYKFYQFWINTDDRDAGRFLKLFTLMEREEIEAHEAALAARPEAREAQQALAMDITSRVHGAEAAAVARSVSRIIFDRGADPRTLDADALDALRQEIPFAPITIDGDAVNVLDMLVSTGLSKSKGDARRQLQQGAVTVNGRRLSAEEQSVSRSEAIGDGYFLVRKGGRDVALIRVAEERSRQQ